MDEKLLYIVNLHCHSAGCRTIQQIPGFTFLQHKNVAAVNATIRWKVLKRCEFPCTANFALAESVKR
jgi:hypothetical protein